jgi:tetratricopeptide (TPR) repeat protein
MNFFNWINNIYKYLKLKNEFKKQNYATVIRLTNKVKETPPINYEIYKIRGISFLNLGNQDEARVNFQSARELFKKSRFYEKLKPIEYELIDLIVTSYLNQKSYTDAIKFLNNEFINTERTDYLHFKKHCVFYEMGDMDNALKEIELALKINPENLDYYHHKKVVKHYFDNP